MQQRFEYLVVEIREGMVGGKMSGDKVEGVLNEKARDGWQLKALTVADVRGTHRPRLDGGHPRDLRASGGLSPDGPLGGWPASGPALRVVQPQDRMAPASRNPA